MIGLKQSCGIKKNGRCCSLPTGGGYTHSIHDGGDPTEFHNADVNICKDHCDKTEVLDPLAVEDLISYNLNNRRKLARLITQYRNIKSALLIFRYLPSRAAAG